MPCIAELLAPGSADRLALALERAYERQADPAPAAPPVCETCGQRLPQRPATADAVTSGTSRGQAMTVASPPPGHGEHASEAAPPGVPAAVFLSGAEHPADDAESRPARTPRRARAWVRRPGTEPMASRTGG